MFCTPVNCFFLAAAATSQAPAHVVNGEAGRFIGLQQQGQAPPAIASVAEVDAAAPMEITEVVPQCAIDVMAKLEPGLVNGHLVSIFGTVS